MKKTLSFPFVPPPPVRYTTSVTEHVPLHRGGGEGEGEGAQTEKIQRDTKFLLTWFGGHSL